MSFTFDDMKHLKEILSRNRSVGPRVVEAILDRMAAAEEVLTNLRGHEAETVDEDLMKRWRKAAGK